MTAPSPRDPSGGSLFERLKKARIVQVLLVYLGASWGVLQLVDVLQDALSLPDWVAPVALILLIIGLVIILATAWVQSLPSTTAAEEAGERPTDWEVAPSDIVARLKEGQLPHLTWGRAVFGGVVALCLLFGAAGLYVVATGGQGLIGPSEAQAEGSPTAVAVLPFQTRGQGMEVYGEGMVDLLATNLEGLGGLRTINAGTVVSRWQAEIGPDYTAELDRALSVAGGLNARYAVRGSVVAAGNQVRLVADIFDLATGERVDGTQVEGDPDAMLELVDALTVELTRIFVGGREDAASRTGSVTTSSLDALQAYLRGEALFRETRWDDAVDAFTEAVEQDSLFALAWWRLGDAWGWTDPTEPEGEAATERALELSDRLPPRERVLVRADAGLQAGSKEPVDELRGHLQRHPDDADAWNYLGEYALHAPWLSMSPPGESRRAFGRAVELVPTFPPYYTHLLSLVIDDGDEARLDSLLADYAEAGADPAMVEAYRWTWDFFHGTPEERDAAEAHFRSPAGQGANVLGLSFFQSDQKAERAILAGRLSELPSAFELGAEPSLWVVAGRDPAGYEGVPATRAYPFMLWDFLVEGRGVPQELRVRTDGEPSVPEAVPVGVLAARVGDDATRVRVLEALETVDFEENPFEFLGFYGGAATAEEATRSIQVAALLREGRAGEAREVALESLAESTYDPLALFLAGEAEAALGNWRAALGHWEPLLNTWYRPHVRLRQGRAYEALGDTASALEGYRGLLTLWESADSELPPLREAREAVERLGG